MARSSTGPWFYAAKNSWYIWHDGKRVNLKVKGEINEREAVKAWHRLMGGVEDTAPPTQEPTPPPKPIACPVSVPSPSPKGETVSALVKAYLAEAEGRVKPESYRGYAKFLNPFSDTFPDTPPEALTAKQVERFSKKPEWSQSYRNGFIGTVVSLFKWAVETGRMDRSPVAGIKKPAKQSRGRKAVITADDHAKLMAKAKGPWRDFLSLLWLCGCRPGELSGLTATDVDLTNKCVILTAHKTAEQTGKDRLIVLPNEAVGILARLIAKRPEGLLFPGEDGQRLNANNVSCRMRRLCEKAGVKAFAYGYRHTFATDALSQGVPDAHVAALLGHSSTAMLHKHYSHLTSKANVLRESLGKVRS
jgi:integrase